MSIIDNNILLELKAKIDLIAERLDCGAAQPPQPNVQDCEASAFSFGSNSQDSLSEYANGSIRNARNTRPALPDPRLVRKIIRMRRLRSKYFEEDLFADPAWDMLLDLAAARAEHKRVSVTSLCIASGVPPTTALRWISQMTEAGLLERVEDDTDRRRAFISLTEKSARAIARYFADVATVL